MSLEPRYSPVLRIDHSTFCPSSRTPMAASTELLVDFHRRSITYYRLPAASSGANRRAPGDECEGDRNVCHSSFPQL